jgi:hypothetical protein
MAFEQLTERPAARWGRRAEFQRTLVDLHEGFGANGGIRMSRTSLATPGTRR